MRRKRLHVGGTRLLLTSGWFPIAEQALAISLVWVWWFVFPGLPPVVVGLFRRKDSRGGIREKDGFI